MKRVIRIVRVVNGQSAVRYRFGEVDYTDLTELLKQNYKNQGALYSENFDVSEEDAALAGWHPQDTRFNSGCDGWEKAVLDGFFIKPEETQELVDLADLVRGLV